MKRLVLRCAVAIIGMAIVGATPLPAFAQQPPRTATPTALRLPFTKYSLPNGLTVVLAESRATPTVAVEIMYHVGSKNEHLGHTGFAHLFEHVMFTGSGHVPYGTHDKYTEGVGGENNGSTNNDVTQYYETIPSNYLQTALWLESDRMGWLLDSLDEAKFRAQRDIVKNERRQRTDNQPYARDHEVLDLTLYPAGHPYSWPVVGSMADLSAATVEDVKAFFRLYYAPNNATLVIAGDFDPAQARAWVAKYFNDMPRGQPITRPVVPRGRLAAEKRLVFEDRVQVPRLDIMWPSVGVSSDDSRALDVLSSILTGSRTARLTKRLVYDRQSAASVISYQNGDESVGDFDIVVTPRPGHTLAELRAQTDSVLDELRRTGPTADELARAKASLELDYLDGLQSNLNKAIDLAEGQTFHGDPGYSFNVDYPKTQAVTAADVKRVANTYLTSARLVLSNVPIGKRELAASSDAVLVTDPFTDKTPEGK